MRTVSRSLLTIAIFFTLFSNLPLQALEAEDPALSDSSSCYKESEIGSDEEVGERLPVTSQGLEPRFIHSVPMLDKRVSYSAYCEGYDIALKNYKYNISHYERIYGLLIGQMQAKYQGLLKENELKCANILKGIAVNLQEIEKNKEALKIAQEEQRQTLKNYKAVSTKYHRLISEIEDKLKQNRKSSLGENPEQADAELLSLLVRYQQRIKSEEKTSLQELEEIKGYQEHYEKEVETLSMHNERLKRIYFESENILVEIDIILKNFVAPFKEDKQVYARNFFRARQAYNRLLQEIGLLEAIKIYSKLVNMDSLKLKELPPHYLLSKEEELNSYYFKLEEMNEEFRRKYQDEFQFQTLFNLYSLTDIVKEGFSKLEDNLEKTNQYTESVWNKALEDLKNQNKQIAQAFAQHALEKDARIEDQQKLAELYANHLEEKERALRASSQHSQALNGLYQNLQKTYQQNYQLLEQKNQKVSSQLQWYTDQVKAQKEREMIEANKGRWQRVKDTVNKNITVERLTETFLNIAISQATAGILSKGGTWLMGKSNQQGTRNNF